MKKLLSLLLVLLLLAGLSACGSADTELLTEENVSDALEVLEDLEEESPLPEEEPASGEPDAEEPVSGEETSASETDIEPQVSTAVSETDIAPAEEESPEEEEAPAEEDAPQLDEDGVYTSKDDVALYIHLYGHLPSNFITKKEARDLGWNGGSLEPYAPGMSIGGDYFGNYEGLLPEAPGRSYTECDIDTMGASGRGAKRIVFSNDGLIYYTDDHYESFTLLYGEE